MDVKLIILGVFLVLMYDSVDSWRFRIRLRRIVEPLCKPFCPVVCKPVPGSLKESCNVVCKNLCGRKRRGIKTKTDEGFYVPLPRNFSRYDINGDGFITVNELSSVLNESDDNLAEAFMIADANLDAKLSEEEFLDGPFFLEDDDSESTSSRSKRSGIGSHRTKWPWNETEYGWFPISNKRG